MTSKTIPVPRFYIFVVFPGTAIILGLLIFMICVVLHRFERRELEHQNNLIHQELDRSKARAAAAEFVLKEVMDHTQ